MQLNRFTDYSLRVLLYLAANDTEKATLASVSSYYDISREHLRKVVHELAKLGYIKTYRGKNGGFVINKPLQDINIGTVIALMEGNGPLLDCDSQPCRLTASCALKIAINKAQQAFYATLSEYTLADLMKNKKMVQVLKVIG